MARFLADENFPFPVTEALRRAGHDVITLDDLGKTGQAVPDNAVLDLAIVDGRCLVTLNRRDFIRLHRATPNHSGLIVCTFDPNFEAQADRIHTAVTGGSPLTGRLIHVHRLSEPRPDKEK